MVPQQTLDTKTSYITNVGLYKSQTGKNVKLLQMEDRCKPWTGTMLEQCRIGTNFGLVQTSDWYQRRTGANVGLVQTLDWYRGQNGTNLGLVQT